MSFSFYGLDIRQKAPVKAPPTKRVKIAVREEHLSALIQWNEQSRMAEDSFDLNELRTILSQISEDLSQAASIYKFSKSTVNEEMISKARELNGIIARTHLLENELQKTYALIEGSNTRKPNSSNEIILNLIHTVMNMRFSDEQMQRFNALANGELTATSGDSEYNMNELGNFMANTLYSHNDDTMATITAIREALQNAVDAVNSRRRADEGHNPVVEIKTYEYYNGSDRMMDVVITDNGIGMNLDVLHTSFYQVLNSGKKDQKGATGGFGLAKQKIFSAGRDGWSMDTNGLHSSNFHRSVYYGGDERAQKATGPVKSRIRQEGSSLAMYGVPYVPSYQISALCRKFGNRSMTITVNGEVQEPLFDLNDLTSFDSGLDSIVQEVADEDSRDLMLSTIERNKDDKANLEKGVGGIYIDHDNGFVKVDFYIKKAPWTGNLVCLLNGQYQFEKDIYVPGSHLIANVTTNIRPNTPNYPVAPSRDNFEGNLEGKVNGVVEGVRQALRNISKDDLMKEGLDIIRFNDDQEAIDMFSPEQAAEKGRDFGDRVLQLEQMMNVGIGFGTSKEQREQNMLNTAQQIIGGITNSNELTPEQKQIGNSAMFAAIQDMGKYGSKDDFKREVEKIMKDIFSPVDLVIQKGYMSRDVVVGRPELTSDLALLWKEVLEIAVDYSRIAFRRVDPYAFSDKGAFVPGIMFSKEALGLYLPPRPQKGKNYATIAINAMSIVPLVCKTDVEKKLIPLLLEGHDLKEEERTRILNDMAIGSNDETPITNVTNYMRHLAAHEVTHYLFPDYGDQFDQYHNYQTDLELIMDAALPEIRSKVKAHMPNLRKSLKQLVTAVSSDIKRKQQPMAGKSKSWIKV